MELKELKNYMKRAIELENNKYGVERLLLQIDCVYEPKLKKVMQEWEMPAVRCLSPGTLAFTGVIIGAVLGFITGLDSADATELFINMGTYTVIGGLALWLYGYFNMKKLEEERQGHLKYHVDRAEKHNAKEIAEADKKNEITAVSVAKLKNVLSNTNKELDKLYQNDFIYPKYRNLVALTKIFEYLDSGRCSQLEGADGAYNVYEMESRVNNIVIQMDSIADNLEQIKETQYALYRAITYSYPYITAVSKSFDKSRNDLNIEDAIKAIDEYANKVIESNYQFGSGWQEE